MVLAEVVAGVFVFLAGWHFKMALAPRRGENPAVPHVDGRPLFVPSATATICVGIGLLACALLVLATDGVVDIGAPTPVLRWLSTALAVGLLGRAVGDFRYVGFFKSVRGSRFAVMDTWCYSPLCLALSLAVGYTTARQALLI